MGKMKNAPENKKEKEAEEKEKKEPKKVPETKELALIEEVLAKADVPPEIKQRITTLIASERISPFPHPIASKLTAEHITKMIEYSNQDSKRENEFSKRSQVFNVIYLLLGIGVLVFALIFLADNEDLLKDILLGALAFAGGIGTGYGYKAMKSK